MSNVIQVISSIFDEAGIGESIEAGAIAVSYERVKSSDLNSKLKRISIKSGWMELSDRVVVCRGEADLQLWNDSLLSSKPILSADFADSTGTSYQLRRHEGDHLLHTFTQTTDDGILLFEEHLAIPPVGGKLKYQVCWKPVTEGNSIQEYRPFTSRFISFLEI